jgi:DNA (cytosine-5)-methyltransferase 1
LSLLKSNTLGNFKGTPPVVIDLFSGAGGLSLGFARKGFQIGIAADYDKNAAQTYTANIPCLRYLQTDVKSLEGNHLLDLLSHKPRSKLILLAGAPCQPFSQANMQNNGQRHPSAHAVDELVRILEELKPDAFLFENVVKFKKISEGKSFKKLLKRLSDSNYQLTSTELNAEEFGVPQKRVRFFLAGLRTEKQGFDLTLIPKSNLRFKVRDAISDLPPIQDGGGGLDEIEFESKDNSSEYQRQMRSEGRKLFNHWCTKNGSLVMETIANIPSGKSLITAWDQIPAKLRQRYKNRANVHYNIYRRLTWDHPSVTVVHPRRAMLLHPFQNRIITVREAARLQSFPDGFRFCGGIDSQYQQVANAIPPIVAENIAQFFIDHLFPVSDEKADVCPEDEKTVEKYCPQIHSHSRVKRQVNNLTSDR